MLPQIDKWFEDHKQRYVTTVALGADKDQIAVNIPGVKVSPETDKLAKGFAATMGKQLTDAGFANKFQLTDLAHKVSKTYEFKSVDVKAREVMLSWTDLWFISQKKIKTTSTLDPSDDTKLIIASPAFNDDNHVPLAVEFGIKNGQHLKDLGFNPTFTVTDGKQSWTHKLY